jgi:hypothetical protein
LLRSVKRSLRTRALDCLDYAHHPNPPVLHRQAGFTLRGHRLVRFPYEDREKYSEGP